jgi:hypothetical protein
MLKKNILLVKVLYTINAGYNRSITNGVNNAQNRGAEGDLRNGRKTWRSYLT